MRAKKVKIGVASLWGLLEDFAEAGEAIERGEKIKSKKGVYFENIEAFRKAITPKRMELLHLIKNKKSASLSELAKLVNRNIKNVSDDVNYLARTWLG